MFQVQLTHPFGRPTLRVEGDLTIYTAREAREAFQDALAHPTPPDLDLSTVMECDTAGAQLLVWVKREAAAGGKAVTFLHHSPAVMEVLDLLHLTAELGDPILLGPEGRS